jgi:LPS O-antigen subunit length determinant protein (WzzB/FepE family)
VGDLVGALVGVMVGNLVGALVGVGVDLTTSSRKTPKQQDNSRIN